MNNTLSIAMRIWLSLLSRRSHRKRFVISANYYLFRTLICNGRELSLRCGLGNVCRLFSRGIVWLYTSNTQRLVIISSGGRPWNKCNISLLNSITKHTCENINIFYWIISQSQLVISALLYHPSLARKLTAEVTDLSHLNSRSHLRTKDMHLLHQDD